MTDRTDDRAPLAAPRDIEGNPSATFVRCPDCQAAVFNLRNQRQGHLKWHDELDADVASAQEASQKAQEAAEVAERALGDARRELAALRAEIGAQGPAAAAVPLIGDWPADEIADRGTPTEPTPDAREPYDPSDFPPQPTAAEEAEDDDDAVDLPTFPASRF